ncbi:TRAP transporter small permease [Marinovum sp.]|uniref:TRAP transporter small permease subunit n=1 Tax=Marinovum sp. TaxID=2024839 RepID=UPI002B26FD45|nr:TRAP transporter small permease [Marinovum sp.]
MALTTSRSDRSLIALDRGVGAIETLGAAIGAWVIFGLLWLSVAEILSRNLLGAPLRGQFDVLVLVGPLYGLLGLSYCYRKAGHVRMDLVNRRLTGRSAHLAEVVIAVCALLITVQLFQGSFSHFERSYMIGDTTIAMNWPTWPSKLVAPLSFAVLAARLVLTIWAHGRLFTDPRRSAIATPVPPDPVTEAVD